MPCPFFEPQQPTTSPRYAYARLPLIDEYDGLCRAGERVENASESVRFACCNHGYSKAACGRFPRAEQPSAFRYTVLRESADELQILCIEEREHIPTWHGTVRFEIGISALMENELSSIVRAQATAFCRSYIERFLRK
jgi:hypothetical protein